MTPIVPVGGLLATPPLLTSLNPALPTVASTPGSDFGQVLRAGMNALDAKLHAADDLVRRFALGEAVPMHQVTFALEEARLSMELGMQVRGRLLDGYRELMNMQI